MTVKIITNHQYYHGNSKHIIIFQGVIESEVFDPLCRAYDGPFLCIPAGFHQCNHRHDRST